MTIFAGAYRGALTYSLRLAGLVTTFSLLSTTFTQAIAKAKTWRDEDRRARSLVRNYDGLGNYTGGEDGVGNKSTEGVRWWEELWPDKDGFELWDWVGNVGGGGAGGGVMVVGLGLAREYSRRLRSSRGPTTRCNLGLQRLIIVHLLFRCLLYSASHSTCSPCPAHSALARDSTGHWYPPTIVRPALGAVALGSLYGAVNMYDARSRRAKREHELESRRVRLHHETEDEQTWRREEQEREWQLATAAQEAEEKIAKKWETGDYFGWGLGKLGGK